MARLDIIELQRLRLVPAVVVLATLATYAKRDRTFVPSKAVGTERWHASVDGRQFELLLAGPKFYDTHTQIGGGGAIDLAIHLHRLSFVDAVALLKRRGV